MNTHAENKLKYNSLEEELAQFKVEKSGSVKLVTLTVASCILLLALILIL